MSNPNSNDDEKRMDQAECVSGVTIDESNPFYEPPVKEDEDDKPEVKVLYEQPGSENDDDESENAGKTAEEMLKDAQKKKKSAKKFNSFFKRKNRE